MSSPSQTVAAMLQRDEFSRWLGIELQNVALGVCQAKMRVRSEMVNGFGVAHGGIVFSLADSVLAFASNSHGRVAVAIENSIAYPRAVQVDDILTATTNQVHCGGRIATYTVTVRNQIDQIVGSFRGTVFRTEKEHAS